MPATQPDTQPSAQPATDLYLDLMAKVLTRYGFEGRNVTVQLGGRSYESYLWEMLRAQMKERDIRMVETGEFDAERRKVGADWPVDAESMIGLARMANLRHCVETVIQDGVPGDLIETGAWRGGSCIYMRAILKAHGETGRTVWVADSFEGLPPPDAEKHAADTGDQHHTRHDLAISVDDVKENFRRYDLLDEQVQFLKGWFSDTLPTAPIEQLAVLRLDGDMYSSTIDALDALYDKVAPGGFVIVDDYGAVPACAQAVHDFRDAHGITEPLQEIDWAGQFWRRSS
ncbi:TylF/MycF family methyltransferase [Nocardioides nanhaiensis]|uniref:TylF/MycF family methyltransferase n=1 Tax=Nocardioides nanhaiensis TaxID=1476871 RepID=A0ABP8VVE1_9ACTN